MEYVEGCELLLHNKVIYSDHWSCVFDVALEDQFDENFDNQNQTNKVILNIAKRSHKKMFLEELEKQLTIYDAENDLYDALCRISSNGAG